MFEYLNLDLLILSNALFAVVLGLFLIAKNRSNSAVFTFIQCMGLALWSGSSYLLESIVIPAHLQLLVALKLAGALVFANGIFYFSSTYPTSSIGAWNVPNLAAAFALLLAMFFTPWVSVAVVENGKLLYQDGPGFLVLSAYFVVLAVATMRKLLESWRSNPQQRTSIGVFIKVIVVFIVSALLCNALLPALGNHDFLLVGRMSATLIPLAMFYAMMKHDFLNMDVIINRSTAWLLVLSSLAGLLVWVEKLTYGNEMLNLAAVTAVLVVTALFAQRLQQRLLTTARRKFVRGWYSPAEVLERLAATITQQDDRNRLFSAIQLVLDEMLEFEDSLLLVARFDERGNCCGYRITGTELEIDVRDALVTSMAGFTAAVAVKELPEPCRRRLLAQGFHHKGNGIALPFHSPDLLEGLLFLGERSGQQSCSDADLRFYNSLISFVVPMLYRFMPFEKLEQLYNENRKRLHDAEIQLIRAQKIEAIAHATRQCHHEIRTPLNIIKMGIQRVTSTEELRAFQQVVDEEMTHALSVVDETLAISDLSEGYSRQMTPVDLNALVHRCQRLVDKARYRTVPNLGELPKVTAIANDIQVVLINLIHNAMDAMPKGGTITFTTLAGRGFVEVGVRDTGCGIPGELRAKVWEPYVSGKPTEAGNSRAGRGWGLTIASRIISEHGGTINFHSVEGKGTCFTFTLPIAQEA